MSEELAHSKRGPSGAHRWRRCKGSLAAEAPFPDKAGYEAAEGTVFHEYAAMCLEHGLEPEDFPLGVKRKVDGWTVAYDAEMQHFMHEGLDWIADHIEEGDIVLIERRVSIEPWCGPGEFGTVDVCIIKPKKRLIIVFDWKYGKGEAVSPIRNDQAFLYVLGCWHEFAKAVFKTPDDVRVVLHIEQPRMGEGGGTWETTMEEVLAEGVLIREDALATMEPDAPRTPGPKQCLFCRASGNCPEQAAYLLKVHGKSFDSIAQDVENFKEFGIGPSFQDPAKMSLEARSYVLLHWRMFKRWVDRIHALTYDDLRAGRAVPLLKAIQGRPGHRKYVDEEIETVRRLLIEKLGEEKAIEQIVISPPRVEELAGKKWFAENIKPFVRQPPGKPKLVSIDHKSPALTTFAEQFDSIADDDDEETGE